MHLGELYGLLPQLYQDLSTSFSSSRQPIIALADHTLQEARLRQQVKGFVKHDNMAPETQEEAEAKLPSNTVVEQGTRDALDRALRESEAIQWSALRKVSLHSGVYSRKMISFWLKFAESLVIISHAAETMLPYLPDDNSNHPPPNKDAVRKAAEDRVKDILHGGRGGWRISFVGE